MRARQPRLVAAAIGLIAAVAGRPAAAETGDRITGEALRALVIGKTHVWRSDLVFQGGDTSRIARRTDGGATEMSAFFRTDGSIRRRCTNISRMGDRSPCGGVVGDGDVGTWEIKNDAICTSMTFRKGDAQCFAVERAGQQYRSRQVGGPRSPIDGSIFDVR